MPVSVFDMQTMKHLWSTPEALAIFSEENRLQKWLDFEAALAQVQADFGIIPKSAAAEIVAAARIEKLDVASVAAEVRRIKHTLVPLLREMQKNLSPKAAEYLHFGATTQDVVDTGLVLQLKEIDGVIRRNMAAVGRELLRLSQEHRDTVMAGRTHGVQALPITFGHKCAIWLDEMSRHAERLQECEKRVFASMIVGAVGTQASYGERALEIDKAISKALGLVSADISWAPARDRIVEYTSLLAMIAGTVGKIGRELFHMQLTEVGEVEEGFTEGKLGSSTMPHKRNPVFAENVAMLSRSVRYNAAMMLEAMVHEHERDGISWKAEWKAVPEVCIVTDSILFQAANLLKGLRVNAPAMERNLDLLRGYLLSERVMLELGEKVGKNSAHEWLYEASMHGLENNLSFAEALRANPHIADTFSDGEIGTMTEPAGYLGQIGVSIDRVVARERSASWLVTQ